MAEPARLPIAEDYDVSACAPVDLAKEDLAACLAIIRGGEAVNPESAKRELPLANVLAVARKDGKIVAVGAIKRIRRGYAANVAENSGKTFPSDTPELGYVAVHPDHQGNGLSPRIVRTLLQHRTGALFATTSNPRMKITIGKAGFVHEGQEWYGTSGRLSLWLKS